MWRSVPFKKERDLFPANSRGLSALKFIVAQPFSGTRCSRAVKIREQFSFPVVWKTPR